MSVLITGAGFLAPQLAATGGSWEIPIEAIPADKRTRIGRLDRLCRLLLSASYLAVDDARLPLDAIESERFGLSFGTGLGCLLTDAEFYEKVAEQGARGASPRLFAYTVSSAAAGEVSIALGIKGPNATQHAGFAAGLSAVGYGFDLVESGKADVILAGGGDACGPALVDALRDMGLAKTVAEARPFNDAVPGIVPSEGAGVFVLEREGARPGAPYLGRILGYAAGFEPSLASRLPQPRGIVETARRALANAGCAGDAVDVVVSSAHGTPNDAAELAAIREVYGERPLVLAPKALLGESFAASAVLGLALCIRKGRGFPVTGAAFHASGSPVAAAEAAARIASASVVAVHGLCYSGTVLSLVVHPHE